MMKIQPFPNANFNIGVTACGCPGASTFISQLKHYFPNSKFIGFDSNPLAVGRYICDDFALIPSASDDDFITKIKESITSFNLDLLWIINSKELLPVATWIDSFGSNVFESCQIISPSLDSLAIAENKKHLYEFCKSLSINAPAFRSFTTCDEFVAAFDDLALEGVTSFCFKPSVSSGSRGFRILSSENVKSTQQTELEKFFTSKPYIDVTMSFDAAINMFSSQESFQEMLLMQKVEGPEIDAMLFADTSTYEPLIISQKTRKTSRSGVIMSGEHVWEEKIAHSISQLSTKLKLSHFNGFQLIGGNIIEINPRVSSFIYTNSWCEPATALAYYLELISKDHVKSISDSYPMGAKLIRYFDCIVDA